VGVEGSVGGNAAVLGREGVLVLFLSFSKVAPRPERVESLVVRVVIGMIGRVLLLGFRACELWTDIIAGAMELGFGLGIVA